MSQEMDFVEAPRLDIVPASPVEVTAIATPMIASFNEQLMALWLHGRSRATQRAYRADALRFLVFVGNKPLDKVTLGEVQSFADSLLIICTLYNKEGDAREVGQELAPASRARMLSSVKSLLSFGHRIGLLPANVGGPVRLPTVRNRLAERILEEAEVQRILALEEDPRNRALIRLLYAGGLRVSELCGLTWGDLSPRGDAGQVTVLGKGGKTRAVLLSAATWRELVNWRETLGATLAGKIANDAPVFRSRKKNRTGLYFLDPSQALRIVQKAAKRAGIEKAVSPHWLRHAHASHSLDRGAPIHLVQQTLGHASVATTGRYLHARPSDSSSRYLGV